MENSYNTILKQKIRKQNYPNICKDKAWKGSHKKQEFCLAILLSN